MAGNGTAAPNTGSSDVMELHGVGKEFGGTVAVHPLDLRVERGSIHSLVGENGAGKSTLLGMISGRLRPSHGQIVVKEHPLHGGDPREARRHGIAAVYQEMTLVDSLTAVENVFLGQPITRLGVLDWRAMLARFQQLCTTLQVAIPPNTKAGELPISLQQLVEIMRGLQAGADILILDEPTAALAEQERERLHWTIRRLAEHGTTVLMVSHNLDEVLALSSTVTVMRDGRHVRTAPCELWTRSALVEAMVGHEVKVASWEHRARRAGSACPTVLEAAGVTLPGRINQIALTVWEGEVVGLWGLVGSGRTSLLRGLAGSEGRCGKRLHISEAPVRWPGNPREASRLGVALVPEDRRDALVMSFDAVSNVALARPTTTYGVIRGTRERREAWPYLKFMGFSKTRVAHPVGSLSGGNQQKVVLSKWTSRKPKVLLVDEPTRGIDIGAKAEVLNSLLRLADSGTSIVMTSSDLEEVLAVADRLLIFSKGSVVREMSLHDERLSVSEILRIGFAAVEHEEGTVR